MKKRISVSTLLILGILFVRNAWAESATSNRINGTAEFLLERAKATAIAMLQRDMKLNRYLQYYLPETYKSVTSDNLQLLLQSGPDLWKRSVEADLKNFGAQMLLSKVSTETFNQWASSLDKQYIELLRNVTVRIESETYPVDRIPLNASSEVKDTVNSFYTEYLKAQGRIRQVVSELQENQNAIAINQALSEIGQIADDLSLQLMRFKRPDIVKIGAANMPNTVFYDSIAALKEIDQKYKYYQEKIDEIRREPALVVQMFRLDQLIRKSIASGDNFVVVSSTREYNHFSRYALGLATLSEAESPEQVKSVLTQLALPPVSYAVKREIGVNRFMISSYFGVSGGVESVRGPEKGYAGLSVPVGLEYTHGWRRGCTGVMLSPVDFAQPVNHIINSQESSAEFKDIFAPGIYFTHGLPNQPIVVGFGYSYGPALTKVDEGNRGRGFLFIGLDLPLFNLH